MEETTDLTGKVKERNHEIKKRRTKVAGLVERNMALGDGKQGID